MFRKHPDFVAPSHPKQTIWRYLDFTKLVDLLDTKEVYFTRADRFDDIFEGSIPTTTLKYRNHQYQQLVDQGALRPRVCRYEESSCSWLAEVRDHLDQMAAPFR